MFVVIGSAAQFGGSTFRDAGAISPASHDASEQLQRSSGAPTNSSIGC
jgi:hypothetical protein